MRDSEDMGGGLTLLRLVCILILVNNFVLLLTLQWNLAHCNTEVKVYPD